MEWGGESDFPGHLLGQHLMLLQSFSCIIHLEPQQQLVRTLANCSCPALIEPQCLCAIKPLGQVNRIADGHLLRIHLISPDLKISKVRLAINRGKSAVHRVRAVRDLDAANTRNIETRIEGEPFIAEINFAIGVKIHRRAGINVADVRQMAGDVTGRQIEGAAQSNGRVREITADAITPFNDF